MILKVGKGYQIPGHRRVLEHYSSSMKDQIAKNNGDAVLDLKECDPFAM
jgi:hypothetical protein